MLGRDSGKMAASLENKTTVKREKRSALHRSTQSSPCCAKCSSACSGLAGPCFCPQPWHSLSRPCCSSAGMCQPWSTNQGRCCQCYWGKTHTWECALSLGIWCRLGNYILGALVLVCIFHPALFDGRKESTAWIRAACATGSACGVGLSACLDSVSELNTADTAVTLKEIKIEQLRVVGFMLPCAMASVVNVNSQLALTS